MDCKHVQDYYRVFLKDGTSVPGAAAAHVESCAQCREQIRLLSEQFGSQGPAQDEKYLLREHLKLHVRLMDRWISCSTVRPFMPALLVNFMKVTVDTPVTAHISHCAACQNDFRRIQQLGLKQNELIAAATFLADRQHAAALSADATQVLNAIAESRESGIETCMNSGGTNEGAGEQTSEVSSVRVRHSHQNVCGTRPGSLRYVLTGGVAAAAVLLVIMLLPTIASGNLKKLNQAVNSVSNVHVLRYSQQNELIQELWVSRSLGFKLYKQPQNTLFKDLRSGRVLQAQPGNEPAYLDNCIREEDRYAKLLPFEQLKDLPTGYQWDFIGDDVLEGGRPVKIYELTWETANFNPTIQSKWRGYLDADSYLPYRIERLEKISEQEFELVTILLVSYPSEAQCLEKLKQEGFQRFVTENQPE